MNEADAYERRRAERKASRVPLKEYDGTTTAVMNVEQRPSLWSRVKGKVAETAAYKRYEKFKEENKYVQKGRDIVEAAAERWETSDSPVVHKIQDMNDYMKEGFMEENDHAKAMREIKFRDPDFEMPVFLAILKRDLPIMLTAYLSGDVATLEHTNVGKEVMERMCGEIKLWESEGAKLDPRVLDLSDVELIEVLLSGKDPRVYVRFTTQQVNCVRDKYGTVTEGDPNDIQAVHYLIAMELTQTPRLPRGAEQPKHAVWEVRGMEMAGGGFLL
mmetsp:Transcript_11084/g.38501  ORF Transcript_11084/g.38501 Transcript_11084/m.38501 type:complete len:273 (+) Transcript_11084:150-968(+)